MREAIDDEGAFTMLQKEAREGGSNFTACFEPGHPPRIGDIIDVAFRIEYLHFLDRESGNALR